MTGSNDGLGFTLAENLAAAGANIVLNGIAPEKDIQPRAQHLADSYGVDAIYVAADVGIRSDIEHMIATVSDRFGGVDILVNNAVVRHFSPLEDFNPDDWERSINVNLTAAFNTARLTLSHMKRKGWGRMVNISSYYGWRGAENRIDYVTTKTALIGMARAIAIETAGTGVTCNVICPGSVGTRAILDRIKGMADESGENFDDLAQRYASKRSPIGRFISEDSIGEMLVFLCGNAGADITGTVFPVDGGWLAA
ncbi:beta-D-hydroxybutyrate dehydrogenase [Roseovarius pacificus]|nr:beta-D-hydroxybutyrate dehydrogenase [Roseovarius pacificus]